MEITLEPLNLNIIYFDITICLQIIFSLYTIDLAKPNILFQKEQKKIPKYSKILLVD